MNYFGGKYTKGDVAYHVIIEIIRDIPTSDLLKDWKGFDETKGFGNYWSFVRESPENRKSFKNKIKKWYEENSDKLIWKVVSKLYQREDKEGAPRYPHPSGGYYVLQDKN